MVLTINGVDFRPYLKQKGYKWQRRDIEGENSITTLSGMELRDRLAIKQVLNISLRAMPVTQAARLLKALEPEYVSVIYTDPSVGRATEHTMMVTSIPAEYITMHGGEDWYGEMSFQLTER